MLAALGGKDINDLSQPRKDRKSIAAQCCVEHAKDLWGTTTKGK